MSTRTKVENDWLGCLLKSPIFVVKKASAPKNGVEFCDIARPHQSFLSRTDRLTDRQTNKATYRGGAHLNIMRHKTGARRH